MKSAGFYAKTATKTLILLVVLIMFIVLSTLLSVEQRENDLFSVLGMVSRVTFIIACSTFFVLSMCVTFEENMKKLLEYVDTCKTVLGVELVLTVAVVPALLTLHNGDIPWIALSSMLMAVQVLVSGWMYYDYKEIIKAVY